VDWAVGRRLLNIAKKDDFDFVFCVFPGVDEFAHRGSPFDERVRRAYRDIDLSLSAVGAALKQRGLFDETLFLIVSDHGSSEVHGHFDIGPWMQKHLRLKTLYHTNIFKKDFKAVSMVSGNGMAHLYFKSEKGWGTRVCFEEMNQRRWILDALLERPEVDLLAMLGENGAVHVLTQRGRGCFSLDPASQKISYHFDRDDPLGIFLQNDSRLSADFNTATVLAQTFHTEYPDVFVQLHQIFQSPRTGDVVVSAKKGFDLRERYEFPEHRAGHGAIHREHMHVPLITNQRVERKHLRTTDVFDLITLAR
jgi:arylsulfatase A-like enzyme